MSRGTAFFVLDEQEAVVVDAALRYLIADLKRRSEEESAKAISPIALPLQARLVKRLKKEGIG